MGIELGKRFCCLLSKEVMEIWRSTVNQLIVLVIGARSNTAQRISDASLQDQAIQPPLATGNLLIHLLAFYRSCQASLWEELKDVNAGGKFILFLFVQKKHTRLHNLITRLANNLSASFWASAPELVAARESSKAVVHTGLGWIRPPWGNPHERPLYHIHSRQSEISTTLATPNTSWQDARKPSFHMMESSEYTDCWEKSGRIPVDLFLWERDNYTHRDKTLSVPLQFFKVVSSVKKFATPWGASLDNLCLFLWALSHSCELIVALVVEAPDLAVCDISITVTFGTRTQ